MEESRGARLRRNLDSLQADLALAEASRAQVEGVTRAAEQWIAEQHRSWGDADAARAAEAERRAALLGMRRALEEEGAANEARRTQLAEAKERVAKLRVRGRARRLVCC